MTQTRRVKTQQTKTTQPAKKLKPLPPADSLGQHFLKYFNHPWGYIYAPALTGEKPHWQTESRYPLQPRNLWKQYLNPNVLLGLRFGKYTRYVVLDIDINSPLHPTNDFIAYNSALAALKEIGLHEPVVITSSDSGGLHVYYFFSEELPTFSVACALKFALLDRGLEIKQGQLETFPNVKTWVASKPSNYNAIRLPLQVGSNVHDGCLHPYTNDLERFLDDADSSAAAQDYQTLFQALKAARKRQNILYQPVSSIAASLWRMDLEQRIAEGWTDYGQTNSLLKDIACYGIVFRALADETLFDYIVETAITSPGYHEFCRHQHNIVQRAREWASCCEGFYTPYPSIPNRKRNYKQQFDSDDIANNIVDFRPNLNFEKQQQTIERICKIVAHLEKASSLPLTPAQRATAIIATSKQLYGVGVSKATLHKPEYLPLWHPNHYQGRGKNCVQPLAEPVRADFSPTEFAEIPDPWHDPIPPLTAPEQAESDQYAPFPIMKVLCLPQAKLETQPTTQFDSANSLISLNFSESLQTEFNNSSDKNSLYQSKFGAASNCDKPDLSIDDPDALDAASTIVAQKPTPEDVALPEQASVKTESVDGEPLPDLTTKAVDGRPPSSETTPAVVIDATPAATTDRSDAALSDTIAPLIRATRHDTAEQAENKIAVISIEQARARAEIEALKARLAAKKAESLKTRLNSLVGGFLPVASPPPMDQPAATLNTVQVNQKATTETTATELQPEVVVPNCTNRTNPGQLPIPTVSLVNIGTLVWVFRVRDREWLPGLVEEIEERFNKPSLWSIRLTTGELLPARSLEQLRLR